MISALKQNFSAFIERNDFTQRRIRDVEGPFPFCYGDRRFKSQLAQFFPTRPFRFLAIEKANGISSGVGEAKVVVFIERDAERFDERLLAFCRAGEPAREASET